MQVFDRTPARPRPAAVAARGIQLGPVGNKRTQIRGGTGVFTGRPAYVWISNQIGNTGVQTGFESINNTTQRPFHPDPNHYKPTDIKGLPAGHTTSR